MKSLVLLCICISLSVTAQAAPDEERLGKDKGYPVGSRSNWFYDETVRVGSFTHLDTIWPHNTLARAQTPSELKRATEEPTFQYPFEGKKYSIDDYLEHQRVTGLLIIKDGQILVERYQYNRTAKDRFVSQSMAKSLVSLAIGLALSEGKIGSLDDTVATYVPELKGYAYGETQLRNILRMSSGVDFSEHYNGRDDLAKFSLLLHTKGSIAALRAFNDRDDPEGERFHYASIETQVLAVVVRAVTGKNLSQYLTEKLWQPMGAEADATWVNTSDGLERAAADFSATLRDWGRLGVLLANDGRLNGQQILPQDYLLEATDWRCHPRIFAPKKATPWFGYGYQFWTFPTERRRFALIGIYGQAIYVDPELKLVLVHTAAAKNATISRESMARELNALWQALVKAQGGVW